jgi:hypothetical protein
MNKTLNSKTMIFLFFIDCLFTLIIFLVLIFGSNYSGWSEWSIWMSPFIMICILIPQFLISVMIHYLVNRLIVSMQYQYLFFILNLGIYVLILFLIDKDSFNHVLEDDGFMTRNYLVSHFISTVSVLIIYFIMRNVKS